MEPEGLSEPPLLSNLCAQIPELQLTLTLERLSKKGPTSSAGVLLGRKVNESS